MSNGGNSSLDIRCPKCDKQLRLNAQLAGKRVKCPACSTVLRVPGPVNSASTDDDWLQLDSEPTPSQNPPDASAQGEHQPTKPVSIKPTESRQATGTIPNVAASQENKKGESSSGSSSNSSVKTPSIFDDDLPELAELEPAKPKQSILLGTGELEELVPPVVRPTTPVKKDTSPAATQKRKLTAQELANQQYRVACPVCSTPQYVTVSQQGRKTKCPDCMSEFKIPPPPPGWKPGLAPTTNWGMDLTQPSASEAERDAQRSKSRTDEILKRAETELQEEQIDNLYQGDFDTQTFVKRTFGFCFDITAVLQIVAYCFIFILLFAFARWAVERASAGDGGVTLILALAVPILFLMTCFPMFSAAMVLLESVASGELKVKEWPGFNLFENFGELLVFGLAVAVSAFPGFLLGSLIGQSGGMNWMIILFTMLTTFLLFPVAMLSMLDNGNMTPISSDVIRSLSIGFEAWGVYYFKTAIAFSIVFVAWAILLPGDPLLAGVGGILLPILLFFTTQQLGVLAGDISEHLSLTDYSEQETEVDEEKTTP